MTYCLAIKTNSHLVFASDSRTNAGSDNVNTYSKMFCWGIPGQRQFVLLSAGNLATSQSVVSRINRDIKENTVVNLLNVKYLSDAADYIGGLSLAAQSGNSFNDMNAGFNAESTFIFGGQIVGAPAEIFMIYPQGNHIISPQIAPFLQIGEIKYGKPLLDRVINEHTPQRDAIRAAMVSMDSTMRSNLTVGPPVEINSYVIDTFRPGAYRVFDEDDVYFRALRDSWAEKLLDAFADLPELPAADITTRVCRNR